MPPSPIPKHHRIAERIARMGRRRGLHSHSLLIHGPVGAGQQEVAVRFGQSLFCESGEGPFGACGRCRNCRRVRQGVHPDWIRLEPERKERGLPNITIESLRNLQDRLVLEPFEGGKVVGCLLEAEKMRPEAANSLLKLVEEPPAHAQFILVTENRQRILPTIRSRCLPIPLGPPSAEDLSRKLVHEENWDPTEAEEVVRWSLSEGRTPEEAASEEIRSIREESLQILDEAVKHGEYAFFPLLRQIKGDRETMTRYLQFFRDFLRDTLLIREGAPENLTYSRFQSTFAEWASRLQGADIARLIDRALDIEEALLGYTHPVHTLGTFLSEISAEAGVPRP